MNTQIKNIITDAFILLVVSTVFVTAVNWGFADLKKGKPQHPLTVAVLQQNLETVQSELQKNPTEQVQFQDDNGRTSLMWVSYSYLDDAELFAESQQNRVGIATELLKYSDVSINLKDNDGWTALSWAAWSGLDAIAPMLLDKGAEINSVDKNGYTPLMIASMRGNHAIVSLLIARNADTSLQNKLGQTALDIATEKEKEFATDGNSNFTQTISVLKAK